MYKNNYGNFAKEKFTDDYIELNTEELAWFNLYGSEGFKIEDGECVINYDYPNELLSQAKQAKVSENDNVRDKALNQGVIYKDVLFDSDTDQKVNLLAIIATMSGEETIVWFGMNNQPLECTKEDLINIGGLITQLHNFCWNKNSQIKKLIDIANTIEELDEVKICYERNYDVN